MPLINQVRRAARALLPGGAPRARPQGPPLPPLFFLHVPKCGGTSLHEAIRRTYQREGHEVSYLGAHASTRAAEAAGMPLHEFRKLLLLYYLAGWPHRYVAGHFSHSETAWAAFGPEWKTITLLRDPVARWTSQYFFNRYKRDDHFRITAPLEEYVETPQARGIGCNYVTVFAEGVEPEDAADPAAIQQALGVLGRFAAVGVLERLDVFTRDLERLLGRPLEVGHRRKNPRDPSRRDEELTDAMRARIRALCQPNQQVYDAVASALHARGSWSAVTPADLVPGERGAAAPTASTRP